MKVCEDKFTMEQIKQDYLNEISKIPLLTPSEEKELGKRILDGDGKAIKKLVFHNLRLVVKEAKKYAPMCNRDFLDVCQDGNLGLVKAARKFDYRKGRFSTIATRWIYESIFREKENTDEMIRKTNEYSCFKNKVHKVEQRLVYTLGRKPNCFDIAKEMNEDVRKIESVFNDFRSVLSLNNPIGEEVGEYDDDLFMVVPNENAIPPDALFLENEQKQLLFKGILTLDEREQFILINRWGLNGKKEVSQRKLAQMLNITQPRVGQIERKALKKLKEKLEKAQTIPQKKYSL